MSLAGSTSMTGSRHSRPPAALLSLKQLTAIRQGHSKLFYFQCRNPSVTVLGSNLFLATVRAFFSRVRQDRKPEHGPSVMAALLHKIVQNS
jgi:hypothetical protein